MKQLITLLIALTSIFTSNAAFAETCPASALCPTFAKQTAACGKWYSETKCDPFIDTYQKLSASYDCKRKSDAKPVPAIWLCEEGASPRASEKAATVLAKLKTAKARAFLASADFRATLEGESADHWRKRSLNAAESKK